MRTFGNLNQKTLSTADIDGVRWIYPPAGVSPPLAGFTANTTAGRAPLVVTFTDTSTNIPTAWNWSFRNVTPGNNTQVWFSTVTESHPYLWRRYYSIVLNASNSAGYNLSPR